MNSVDTMGSLRRTHYCGEVPLQPAEVVVCGFAAKVRNLGNLIFIDLRDRTGIVQLAFSDSTPREVFKKAAEVKNEFVLMAKGEIAPRESVNPELPTGSVEILVSELKILSRAETPPFELAGSDRVNDELKLKYRYLELRTPRLTKNLITRHEIARVAREYFYENL